MPNCITGKACKLRGSGYISYVIKKDRDGLYLKITGNKKDNIEDAGGTFSQKNIYLCKLFDCIVAKGDCFKPQDLRKVIPGRNNNDLGFVVAVLMDIRFVESAGRGRYRPRCEGG